MERYAVGRPAYRLYTEKHRCLHATHTTRTQVYHIEALQVNKLNSLRLRFCGLGGLGDNHNQGVIVWITTICTAPIQYHTYV